MNDKFRSKLIRALYFYDKCLQEGVIKKDVLKGLNREQKLTWLAQNDFPKNLIKVREIDDNYVFPDISPKLTKEKKVKTKDAEA